MNIIKKIALGIGVALIPLVTPLISFAAGSGVDQYWYTVDFDKDGVIDQTSSKQTSDQFTITQNGMYYFYVSDVAGNVSLRYEYEIKNIDNTAPTCTFELEGEAAYKKNQAVKFTASDNMSLGSLVVKDSSSNVVCNQTFTYSAAELEACAASTQTKSITFTANGTYTWELKDHAGNKVNGSIVINNIDNGEMTNSAFSMATTWVKRDQVSITLTDAYGSIDKFVYAGSEYSLKTPGKVYEKEIDGAGDVDGDGGKQIFEVTNVATSETFAKGTNDIIARPARIPSVTLTLTFVKNNAYTLTFYDTAGNAHEVLFTANHIDRHIPVISSVTSEKKPHQENVDATVTATDD